MTSTAQIITVYIIKSIFQLVSEEEIGEINNA